MRFRRTVNSQAPRFRFVIQAGLDTTAWFVGLWTATFLRYDMAVDAVDNWGVARVAILAGFTQVALGVLAGLYVHRWRYGTFEEVSMLARVVVGVTGVIVLLDVSPLLARAVPVSAVIVAGFLSLALMCVGRMIWRTLLERWTRADSDGREPVIVIGAGEGGLQVVTAMVRSGPYHPVAVLDDNPDLRNLRLKGVKVMGDRTKMVELAKHLDVDTVIVAIPSASGELIRDIAVHADAAGLRTLVLPAVGDLLGSKVGVSDIRPLTEADLLGRRELSLDVDSVAGYLTGRRVLVTGAGGSIGSELCRQIHRFAPESLVMLDRDESALQAVQVSIEGRGLLDHRNLVVGCIRDQERMAAVFAEHRPEVVFHAAALKHLPLLEMYPEEGWKTNVWGTQNLLELAGEFGVERFVNISTDKAAGATSVLGATKRVAEQLTSFAGRHSEGTYLSVRFGNVLGSRGSVLPLFRSQIEQGGPVTVTHPDVTRFFMTIPEACELVVQAGALAEEDGNVLVLDMGEPVRIADLAHRLIAGSDRRVEVVYTGLRPGEKMHEVLFSPDEQPRVSGHPLISSVHVPAVSAEVAAELDPYSSAGVIDLRAAERGALPVAGR